MTELSELCKACGGDCCRRPWMTTDEYTRLTLAIGNDAMQVAQPYFIMGGWQFKAERCPGLTPTGCILPYSERPEACRIYPFVKVPTTAGPRLFLDVSRCPHWDVFGGVYEDTKKEIENVK